MRAARNYGSKRINDCTRLSMRAKARIFPTIEGLAEARSLYAFRSRISEVGVSVRIMHNSGE
jgi:hypothetical protein